MLNQKGSQEGQGRKYNALIIGAGGQGAFADAPGSGNEGKIISYAHAFCDHNGFVLSTITDIDFTKAIKAAEIYNCAWLDFKSCDIKIYMEHAFIDIAVVATPDNTHYEILKQLAEYPLKLVICEKPICDNLQQAREIAAIYQQKNIPILVNYTRRFLPYYEELKRLYRLGLFGKIVHCEALFNRGWTHSGTHAADFFNWFFEGEEVKPSLKYAAHDSYRIWRIAMDFEKYSWHEERIHEQPVWRYYDFSHWYIAENAYRFLEGREPLKCTAEDALRALEICYGLMEEAE